MKNVGPLTVLFITVFIDLLGFGLIIPILPNLVTKLFMKPEWMAGLVAGVYSVAQFLFSPFWGTLSDRFGRRPIILLSVALTALSYLLFSYAVSVVIFSLLVIYRFLAGMGSANIAAANAYIADITTKENRAKSMALIGAAFGLGFIFGPPAGGFIKEEFGADWVGYVAFMPCLLNLIFAWFWLPESIQGRGASHPPQADRDPFPREPRSDRVASACLGCRHGRPARESPAVHPRAAARHHREAWPPVAGCGNP